MSNYEFIEVERNEHVTTVFLNRPKQANALHGPIMSELEQVSHSFLDDEQTRVVIFAGRGKHFSAGADLKQKPASQKVSMLMRRRHTGLGARMIRAIHGINQVTIAAVQMIKQSINMVSSALDQAVMHMDTDQNMLTAGTKDRAEGIDAYFNKRIPKFTGD